MPGPVTALHERELNSQANALLAARAALEKQAEGVVVLDLRALSSVTDFFVVATAGSPPHFKALQEHLDAVLEQHGCAVGHVEGAPAARGPTQPAAEPQWVLMDCGEIVVHLFNQHARSFYRLEDLWADAPRVPVS